MNQSTSPLTHGFFPLSFLSTDYHRLSQIYLISKYIVIITDYNLSIIHPLVRQPRPRRIDNRNFIA